MGKATGFIDYERKVGTNRECVERIKDFDEFHLLLPEEEQRIQGARCMECGVPFCQSGILIKGMVSGCPLNNLIPEWNDLVYKGKWDLALERLFKTNPFPEFTGRVCPAPCESACTAGLNGKAVSIKENERSIIDKGYRDGRVKPILPEERTNKKVAIVGSGPAGLSAAFALNRLGHNVTVYERSDRVGGLLMYGIPNMKLDKKVISKRVSILEKEGIEFLTNVNIGVDVKGEDLLSSYDAVLLATGASKPRDLKAPGRELNGIHFAVDFLKGNTKSLLDSKFEDENFISAKDKDVIVIGGGDTGTDCVATSIRHDCNSLTQLEIMPISPKVRSENNPWPEWPKTLKVDYGQEEFKALYGRDPREYEVTVKSFNGNENGELTSITTVNVKWVKNENGAFIPEEVKGSEKEFKADVVLLAMGFLGSEEYLVDTFNVSLDGRTNITGNDKDYKTSIDKVFVAGDARRGQSLVVWAINEGLRAAESIHNSLNM
ncbi:MAG: glutamate synthase subunit beta [Clostridium sp.]